MADRCRRSPRPAAATDCYHGVSQSRVVPPEPPWVVPRERRPVWTASPATSASSGPASPGSAPPPLPPRPVPRLPSSAKGPSARVRASPAPRGASAWWAPGPPHPRTWRPSSAPSRGPAAPRPRTPTCVPSATGSTGPWSGSGPWAPSSRTSSRATGTTAPMCRASAPRSRTGTVSMPSPRFRGSVTSYVKLRSASPTTRRSSPCSTTPRTARWPASWPSSGRRRRRSWCVPGPPCSPPAVPPRPSPPPSRAPLPAGPVSSWPQTRAPPAETSDTARSWPVS